MLIETCINESNGNKDVKTLDLKVLLSDNEVKQKGKKFHSLTTHI